MFTAQNGFKKKSLFREIQLRAKRLFDILGALIGLLLLSPLLAFISLAILFTFGKPVLFKQNRPGFKAKLFTIYKFRTMIPPIPGENMLFTDKQRLTRLGRFLRKTSMDELPELWNVIKGDMSLVGPRPLLKEYLEKYTEKQKRRHNMLPGITGMAQVHGRQNIPFSKRLELDIWYIDHWSLSLDVKILFKTFIDVFKGTGVISGQDIYDVDDLGLSSDLERNSKPSNQEKR